MTGPTTDPMRTEGEDPPTFRRKMAMARVGLTGAAVANALSISEGAVSQVVNGNLLARPAAARIMAYVADRLGRTVDDLWPERRPTLAPPGETP